MKNDFLRLGKFLLLVLLFLIITACSGTNEESATSDPETNNDSSNEGTSFGGTLTFAFNAQPPTLDPTGTTATATRDIARNIFEQLVTFDSNLEVKPMLAESFDVDTEAKTVTFQLRQGVKFHNGEEMLADDVVASMEKWAQSSAQANSFLSGISFQADGDYTVVAQLEQSGSLDMFIFADQTQIAAIMPKEIVEAATQTGVSEYIGTGPYQFVDWRSDQHIHLERFEDYQSREEESDGLSGKKMAYADDIYFQFVSDPSTRVTGIQTGEYHIGNFIPFDNAAQLEADPNVTNSIQEASFPGLVFNKRDGVFKDIKLRQAVAAALNMEDMMYAAYGNEDFFTLRHELMLEEQIAWYTDAGKGQYDQRNEEKARELLAEAGYNGEEVRILASREYEDYYSLAVVAQQQLESVGMNVKLEVYDWATVLEKRADPSAYDMFTSGWALRPTPVQYPFLASDAEWPGWTDSPEIDRLIDEIQASTSQEEALALTTELQEEFWNYLPIIKPGNSVEITSHRNEISGFDYLNGPILWNISIDD
ncbi:ABC transporter substrate-binding protein [Caldalkalibacillus horti]|uniref:Peptide/nickel transport system substrate-binding protein n=1 Tax=Caldalkalibacillus horti TaxID=77523 RepID=A0ABT9VV66_9BACI|nr:ABC transporter substrate-binding protein [Bacillus horti]MDQ0164887.1 peptide/nickel transport system substrate-binding protein [Bacillus horti]